MKRWLIITFGIITIGSLSLYAQDTLRLRPKYQIGFGVGPSYNFKKSNPCCKQYHEGIYLRKYISRKIAIEGGAYVQSYSPRPNTNLKDDFKLTHNELYTVDVPVSVNYFLLPRQKKLNTYIGGGIVATLVSHQPNIAAPAADNKTALKAPKANTVNMQLTHGVVYEVNTRLQVNESIHFIPKPGDNCISIDLGVGYKF